LSDATHCRHCALTSVVSKADTVEIGVGCSLQWKPYEEEYNCERGRRCRQYHETETVKRSIATESIRVRIGAIESYGFQVCCS